MSTRIMPILVYNKLQTRQFQSLRILHRQTFSHWVLRYDYGYDDR